VADDFVQVKSGCGFWVRKSLRQATRQGRGGDCQMRCCEFDDDLARTLCSAVL